MCILHKGRLSLEILPAALTDELGLVILIVDVGDERLVVYADQLGLAVLLENVSNELGLGVPLTTLTVSIGCCDIGTGLRSEDDVNGSINPPQPRVRVREISSMIRT